MLEHYGLRPVVGSAGASPSRIGAAVRHGGGTANANVVVETDHGAVFLKRRSPKYSAESFVAFDHRLMEHLAPRDVGTPLALESIDGARWLRLGECVYEVYPLVEGAPHDRHSVAQIADAGRALAVYHRAVRDFVPPAGKEWPRYRDPAVIETGLAGAADAIAASLTAADAAYLRRQVADISDGLADVRYDALPKLVVHGDYHPGNVLYRDDRVVGIFDLDWATRQPRVLDLADGLMLFCGDRSSEIDSADIVSLTQTWRPSRERGRAFMEAYLADEHVTGSEMDVLPLFVRALWLSCRVEGMAKVPADARAAYLLDGLLEPLRALDALEALY